MPELNDPEIYQSVLDDLPTGVYIVDRNRRIRFWNEGAEQITGYLRQDVVGRLQREHLLATSDEAKDLDSDANDPVNRALRDGKSSSMDVSILHKDGYRVPIVLRTKPIRNSHGAVVGAAESFNKNFSSSEWTRRHSAVAESGCLDEVTGVAAQSFMETHLRENLITFAEHNIPFGILLIQVDGMEQFRVRRGPGVVPTILRVVAQSIEYCLRSNDLVGRWGESQFLAILAGCRESEVALVGERVTRMISRSEIEWWGDNFSVTSVAGGAGCHAGDNAKVLIARAEASLKASIGKGGNCVTVLT